MQELSASLGQLALRAGVLPEEACARLSQVVQERAKAEPVSLARLLIEGGLSPSELEGLLATGSSLRAVRCDGCGAETPQQLLPPREELPCSRCGALLLGFSAFGAAGAVTTQAFRQVLPLPAGPGAGAAVSTLPYGQVIPSPGSGVDYVYVPPGRARRSLGETSDALEALLTGDPDGDQAPSASLPSERIAGFRLLRPIGKGGMGQVFLAEEEASGRQVALKLLHADRAQGTTLKRFQREAEALGRVRHPNVVEVVDSGLDAESGLHYLALEYLPGGSLSELLDKSPFLPERTALEISRNVCSALEAAMDHGLVHRDVKPGNILLDEQGNAKLADLGLIKDVDSGERITATGLVMGTPAYLAPEQAIGQQDLDIRVDLYSLGCCLYEMLTGVIPFIGESKNLVEIVRKRLREDLPDPRSRRPDVSYPTVLILRALTARERDDRYPFPSLVLRDIDRVLAGGDVLGPEDMRVGPSAPPLDREQALQAPPPPQGDRATRPLPVLAGEEGPAPLLIIAVGVLLLVIGGLVGVALALL